MKASLLHSCLLAAFCNCIFALTIPVHDAGSAIQVHNLVAQNLSSGQDLGRLFERQVPHVDVHEGCSQEVVLVNNCFGGDRGKCQGLVTAYIYGQWPEGGPFLFVGPDSQFHALNPGQMPQDNMAIKILQGQSVTVRMPGCLSAGRINFVSESKRLHFAGNPSAGRIALASPDTSNPADPSANDLWSFMEFTSKPDAGLTINPSQVDWAGLPIAMTLERTAEDGDLWSMGGMKADALTTICENLMAQAMKDGRPWNKLCKLNDQGTGYVRVLSPFKYIMDHDKTDGFKGYWEPYVDQVWNKYRNEDLRFDMGEKALTTCRVHADDQLHCSNGHAITKPTTTDIFSCGTGPFALTGNDNVNQLTARLCAAFQRSTIHTGKVQPSDELGHDTYYKAEPTNFFSRSVHDVSVGGAGYAFPVDWVDGPSVAPKDMPHGQLTVAKRGKLTVTVGGWRPA